MSSINLFKLYNLKKITKDKLILILTMLIIFITTALSIAVPTISQNISNYDKQNIRIANGGDLFIQANYPSKPFNDELLKIKNQHYKITYKEDSSCILKNLKNIKIYGHLIISKNDLKDNEIILSTSLANNLMVKPYDKVTVNSKIYTVKAIENIPSGVTNDERILGYAKIKGEPINKNLIYINGNTNGEALKQRLESKENGYTYTSIKDQEKALEKSTTSQTASLGILTSIGYMLSSAVVISTCIVTIIKRKKDIAIMKLLSIKNKPIKNALRLEMSIIVLIPIILGAAASVILSSLVLKLTYLPDSISLMNKFLLILKGVLLNLFMFIIFLNLPINIINSITGLQILKDSFNNSRINKKLFTSAIILIPIMIILYCFYSGEIFNFIVSALIIFIILMFLMLTHLIIKLISRLPFKNKLIMYSLKDINKNIFSLSLVSVSLSITIVVILTAFSLNNSINASIDKSLKSTLPYNYFVNAHNHNLDKVLTKKNGINGYIKEYTSAAKVLNNNLKNKFVQLSEIKQSDYKLKLNIIKGQSLFSSTVGCLITSKYQSENKLKLGDTLKLLINNKIISLKIKGIYDNSVLNSIDILTSYKGLGTSFSYYINSKTNAKWMDKIGDCSAAYVDTLGSEFSELIENYLKTFKFLSIMIIVSSIIFNLNLLSLTFIDERKDETIMRAIGLGKSFISKVYVFKGLLMAFISTIISYFFYKLILNSISAIMNIKAYDSSLTLLLTLAVSLVLSILSLAFPFARMQKYNSFEFLREN
ncbi:FtsX-like permease family protein [Clostridium hydrogenum]|uniref:FtsX-like permease family protein n=1 Tax=Clostridium hydrogenum TaxID=2855764 RepID=UPI001F1FAA58|nr:FtsX-like permease family protein [Clostridium hydrogenum]